MSRFAAVSLACIMALAATISRADEEAPRTFRLQRQTANGVEEKFVTEDEYNQFNRDAEERERVRAEREQRLEGMVERTWKEFRPAISTPQPNGPYVRGEAVNPQPSPSLPTAAYPAPVSPPPVTCQPGTYSVSSDGKRSILLNTTTGVAWLLVIDEQGSHWQEIKFPVPIALQPLTPLGPIPNLPQPQATTSDAPLHPDDPSHLRKELSQWREMSLMQGAELERFLPTIKEQANEIAELRKKLAEAYGKLEEGQNQSRKSK